MFYREGEEIPDDSADADWMEDMPPLLMEALLGGDRAAAHSPGQEDNAVADLLVSQTETADIVLLNKIDLVEDDTEDLTTTNQLVTALNPKAIVRTTTFGEVPLEKILAVAGGRGVVEAGVVDDHRDAIQAAERANTGSHDHSHDCVDQDCTDPSHSHSHKHSASSHSHSAAETVDDPDGADTSHSHGHSHAEPRADPDCTDISHSHSHDHAESCNDPGCTDTSHSHSHGHADSCSDPECTDTSHSHSHSHANSLDKLGIGSFVYRARRPFHPQRLAAFLRYLPISRGLPDESPDEPSFQISEDTEKALQRVVRSKGFVWLGDSNVAANYWSHSGSSFELQCLGRWWSTLSRAEVCSVCHSY